MSLTRNIYRHNNGLDVFGRPTSGWRKHWLPPLPFRNERGEFTWAANIPEKERGDYQAEYGEDVCFGPTSLLEEEEIPGWTGVFFREGAFRDHNAAFLQVYERLHRW